jgi:hypothetical protein
MLKNVKAKAPDDVLYFYHGLRVVVNGSDQHHNSFNHSLQATDDQSLMIGAFPLILS